jgi:arsenate reductase
MRSQMAEGFFNYYNKNPEFKAISAGISPASKIIPETITVMREKGVDVSKQKPKPLTRELVEKADRIYALAQEAVPFLPKEKTVAAPLQDPLNESIDVLVSTRNKVEELVKEILKELKD